MFVDIDYKRRMANAKIHLAKPNKQVISNIYEAFDRDLKLKLGNINELTFSISYKIENRKGELVNNKHIDMIKEKMLLKYTMEGYEEWYIVEDIDEDGEDTDTFNVTAYSLGYELKHKRISDLSEEVINPDELLDLLLEGTLWSKGFIDENFMNMSRKFESSGISSSLSCVLEMAETFGALLVFDTINRTISLVNPKENGMYRGLTVDYGRLLRSIKKSRSPKELTTRLYVYGDDGLSIQRVNPTGENYLEDFTYFLYPFERDDDKNTLRSSYFMSDELCHAILDHEELMDLYSTRIKNLVNEKVDLNIEIASIEADLELLNMELENILDLLDVAKSAEDEHAIGILNPQRDEKIAEITSKAIEGEEVRNSIRDVDDSLNEIYDTINNQANFTDELKEELKFFIIESEWTDDRYIDDEELYADAIKEFEKIRTPQIIIEAGIANIYKSIQEQYYWDKLILGDFINVKYPQMNIEYRAKIIEMNFELDNDSIDLVIANSDDLMNDADRFLQLLYDNKTATGLIETNKYKWDKISYVEDQVHSMLTEAWDTSKRKIIAGVRNSVEVGRRGIIITNPDYPDEVIIMQSGIIALSMDRGETWKTAITPEGIVAERLMGRLITGQNLIITNSSGSFIMDQNGVRIDADSFIVRSSSGDRNLIDDWNKTGDIVNDLMDDGMVTPYEKEQLNNEWTKIKIKHDSLTDLLNVYFEDGGASKQIVVDFQQAYTSLFEYLHIDNQIDGFPLLDKNNFTATTVINKNIFDERFNNYRILVPEIEELLTEESHSMYENALKMAKDAMDLVKEIDDGISYRVDITSTNGLIFKNNNIDTRIYATVFKGDEDITSQIPDDNFAWKKIDKDGNVDTAWTTVHNGVGSSVSITAEDVYQKATFSCDIDIDIDFE